jgi:hypothetical protein
MKTVFAIMLVVILATPLVAVADPPINGTYTSTDLGGQMLFGRYSESWSAPNGRLQIGNTTNKLSWDGATLGTQWWMYCSDIAFAPLLISDTVVNGNGFREWLVTYSNGILILDGNGPWGNGTEPSYTATLDSYQEIKTFQYANNEIVQCISNVSIQAQIIGYNDLCVAFSIFNQEELGNTDADLLPPDYPSFLEPNTCAPTRTMGEWGEVDEITLIVTGCTVANEETTWGKVKALYQ